MFSRGKRRPRDDAEWREAVIQAGETCSMSAALTKQQIEEETELKLKGVTDSVARVASMVEADAQRLEELGRASQLNAALLEDCGSFLKEFAELESGKVDAVCRLAEEIERRVSRENSTS